MDGLSVRASGEKDAAPTAQPSMAHGKGKSMRDGDELKQLGMDASWRIVVVDSPSAAERIAAEELCTFLRKEGLEIQVVSESEPPESRRIVPYTTFTS